MNWQPVGTIRREELLAILEALRFTLHRAGGDAPEYAAGFDDALAAIARSVNLGEHFQPASPRVTVELPIKLLPGEVTK